MLPSVKTTLRTVGTVVSTVFLLISLLLETNILPTNFTFLTAERNPTSLSSFTSQDSALLHRHLEGPLDKYENIILLCHLKIWKSVISWCSPGTWNIPPPGQSRADSCSWWLCCSLTTRSSHHTLQWPGNIWGKYLGKIFVENILGNISGECRLCYPAQHPTLLVVHYRGLEVDKCRVNPGLVNLIHTTEMNHWILVNIDLIQLYCVFMKGFTT